MMTSDGGSVEGEEGDTQEASSSSLDGDEGGEEEEDNGRKDSSSDWVLRTESGGNTSSGGSCGSASHSRSNSVPEESDRASEVSIPATYNGNPSYGSISLENTDTKPVIPREDQPTPFHVGSLDVPPALPANVDGMSCESCPKVTFSVECQKDGCDRLPAFHIKWQVADMSAGDDWISLSSCGEYCPLYLPQFYPSLIIVDERGELVCLHCN